MHKTSILARSPLFRIRSEKLPLCDRLQLSYERAKAVVDVYRLTSDDVLHLSAKYWEFQTDPILMMDASVGTLLTIHYNLCAGTLAMFSVGRPDLTQDLQDLLSFRVSGQYCLTELGHGLDAIHLETTVTMLPNGELELNTPVDRAAKYMPPTAPCGIPCVSIVFARLMVDGEDRGVKPFLVPLHDGSRMYGGIICKPLSQRGGAHPVNHALTYFHHVRLPKSALLGDDTKAPNERTAFFYNISRVICGTLSMGGFGLSMMRIGCHVAGCYSLRRQVIDAATGISRPIFSFSTQYIPILTAISQTLVMQAFSKCSHANFVDSTANLNQKHVVAAIFKATILNHAHNVLSALGDRCGAQGLFEINQLSVMQGNIRGAAIAEGDILGIAIRFGIEILLGRITLTLSTNPESLLAKHEKGLITDLRKIISQSSGHREARMESILLPQCQALIEAIGHRFAFDAAVEEGLEGPLIDVYVASVICLDPAWYVENAGISRWVQKMKLLEAAILLRPHLQDLLACIDAESYVTAPIVSDERWDAYVRSLDAFGDPPEVSQTALESSVDATAKQPGRSGKSRARL